MGFTSSCTSTTWWPPWDPSTRSTWGSHRHVLLLHGGRHGTPVPEVHLVEEIPHHFPNGPVHRHCGARLPTALYRLQLSQGVCLVDRLSWSTLLLPLLRLL